MRLGKADIETQFIAAFNDYADSIFRYCYLRVSDRELAKELVAETYLKAWRSISDNPEPVINWRAFLYRIAGNLVIDHYRRHSSLSLDLLAEQGFEPVDETEQAVNPERKAETRRILLKLEELDDKHREVLMMRYVDDMQVKEIAALLNQSENVVSVRINRAIKQLRQVLNI
jgi:RNA polymerase sigma-70 factor, ECF subfamily